jgi:hypothetical protein
MFRLYPNPTTGSLKIVKQEGESNLTVIDMNGRVVYSKGLMFETEEIDLSHFAPGFYNVQLADKDGRTAHKKLVVQ